MPIPTPEPGLVISYAYLWDHEAKAGRENGAKDRPCVIALSVVRRPDGETVVTVLPLSTSRRAIQPERLKIRSRSNDASFGR